MTPAGANVGVKEEIEALADHVSTFIEIRRAAIDGVELKRQLQQMTAKLPNLAGVASAIDKLTSAIESDATRTLNKVEAVHAKRERVFTKAGEKISDRDKLLDAADAALEKLDQALGDNGNPTKEDSAESSQSSSESKPSPLNSNPQGTQS